METAIPVMLLINYLISYFLMSNIMVYSKDHLYNHWNKIYMGLFMASLMGLAELWVMGQHMVNNQALMIYNVIFAVIAISSAIAIRKQTLVNDSQFLKSMIEHHSSALLMADQVLQKTQDQEIAQLSNHIIQSQSNEINQMTQLLERMAHRI